MKIIGFITSSFVACLIIVAIFNKAIKEMKANYVKSDTSIIITNGRADTIITKKTLPWYLK